MKRLAYGRLAAVAMLALGLTGCATYGPEEDPVQIRLDDLDTRLARIERVVTNQTLLELSQRLDAVQNELRLLRGQVEESGNTQQSLAKQQRDLYADLDRRLAALETARTGSLLSGTIAPAPGAASPEAERDYGRAFDALKAGEYPAAISGFQGFLGSWPAHPLADNAQYWLGQAHYVNRSYEPAAAAFANLVAQWPTSSKAADGMLKLALCQLELQQRDAARQTLQRLTAEHAGTDAARQGQERLARLPR